MKTFDNHLLAEAALCLWEAMIDSRLPQNVSHPSQAERDAGIQDGVPAWKLQMEGYWDRYGTVELRHQCIFLAPSACLTFDILGIETVEKLDLIPYDWEFIPSLLPHVDWSEHSLKLDPWETAQKLIEKHTK